MKRPTDRLHRLPDGRMIGFAEFGVADGAPLFYCHGLPSARLEGRLFDTAAVRNRARLIAIDRPGFGLSSPKARFQLADWPDDVASLADALGISRFSVLGVSAGGPYALVCGWKMPGWVQRVGVVCGLGPVYDPAALSEMKLASRISFSIAQRAPWLLRIIYNPLTVRYIRHHPEVLFTILGSGACSADRRAFERKDVREILCASWCEALIEGAEGPLSELQRFVAPWGFDPSTIEVPVHLWHGNDDTVVPVSHGRRYAQSVKDVRSRFLAGEGHFSVPIRYADEIVRTLVAEEAARE
jgi:pimeloyl-ACP methyl ester carboxylesterase